MVSTLILYWMIAWAIVTPVSIAGTSLLFFPLVGLYVLLGVWTFKRWPPPWGPVEKAFSVFWLLSLVSAIHGGELRQSQIRLSKDLYFSMLVLLGAYLAREPEGTRLMKASMIAAIGTAAFGVLQFLIGVNQTNSSHGVFVNLPHWLEHAPRSLLDFLSLVNSRVTGTRAHPITYAEGLLFPLGYTLSLLATRRQGWWKWAVGQYLVLLALVFSQSRGAWIAAVVMVLALVVLRRDAWLSKRLALIYLPVVLLCILSPSLHSRAVTITDSNFESNSERLLMWRAGSRMIQDHPLLGIGTGLMHWASPAYQPEANRLGGPWSHLHNMYINVAAERGSIFFIIKIEQNKTKQQTNTNQSL